MIIFQFYLSLFHSISCLFTWTLLNCLFFPLSKPYPFLLLISSLPYSHLLVHLPFTFSVFLISFSYPYLNFFSPTSLFSPFPSCSLPFPDFSFPKYDPYFIYFTLLTSFPLLYRSFHLTSLTSPSFPPFPSCSLHFRSRGLVDLSNAQTWTLANLSGALNVSRIYRVAFGMYGKEVLGGT